MAAPSGQEDDDPLRESRAYSQSIYLMLGMPYLLLAAGTFAVYRGLKVAQQRAQQAANNPAFGISDNPPPVSPSESPPT